MPNKHECLQSMNKISQELLSRIFKPLYIPLLALISSFLLIKSKNSQGFSKFKFKIFTSAVIIISLSEISTKFYSANIFESFLIKPSAEISGVLSKQK